jgi:hypothetical protein
MLVITTQVSSSQRAKKIRSGKGEKGYMCGSKGRENEMENEGQNKFEFVENHVNIQNHAPSSERCLLGRYSQPQQTGKRQQSVGCCDRVTFCFPDSVASPFLMLCNCVCPA